MNPLPLQTARRYADKAATWLQPWCERIEVVGSVRRDRPFCNDIDLLVIPRLVPDMDLLGHFGTPQNLLYEMLVEYVLKSHGKARWRKADSDDPPRHGAVVYLLEFEKCHLDIFTASASNWVTRLICRTGSKEHNIFMCERAQKLGGRWAPQEGLYLDGALPASLGEEADFYSRLSLDFIPPAQREAPGLGKFIRKLTPAPTP